MKRLMSLITLLLILSAMMVKAERTTINNITYELSSSSPLTASVVDGKNAISSVIIPPTITVYGRTYTVTSIGDYAFSPDHFVSSGWALQTVDLPQNLTSIGKGAFSDCSYLEKINLPDKLTSIGDYAFYGCKSLKEITLPDSLTTLGAHAFRFCGIKIIDIPGRLITIGHSAFQNCSSLKTVYMYWNVPTTGDDAFLDINSDATLVLRADLVSVIREDYRWSSWFKNFFLEITDLSQLNNTKQYYLHTIGRGTLGVIGGELASTYIFAQGHKCDTATPFALLPYNNSYYFYSTADKRFITSTGGETDTPQNTDGWTLTQNSNGYFMFICTSTGNVLNINSNPGIAINTWGQTQDKWDGGNQFIIEEAGEFDPSIIRVKSVSLNENSATLTSAGETLQLTANVVPIVATIEWTSSNTDVAAVSNTGLVTAVANGTAIITATATDGSGKNATCTITVKNIPVLATGVSLDKTSETLTSKGQTVMLTATVMPSNASNKSVTWTSSNTSVATVSDTGLVTAKGEGTATITVTTADGSNKSATCKITVMTPAEASFTGSEAKISTSWYADRSMEPRSGLEEMHAVHYQPGNTDRSGDGTSVTNNQVFVFNLLSGFRGGVINASTTDMRELSTELTIVFNTKKYGEGIMQVGVSGKTYTMTATNNVVSASLSGETLPVVKLLDTYKGKEGRWIEFQNNAFAKDLLNAYPIFNADGKTTDAFYTEMTLADLKNLVPMNLTGDIDFRVRYLRPIDITHVHSGKAYLKDGAEAGYDELYMADIFNFTDWRQIYPFGYNITNQSGRESWMDFYGIHEIYFNIDEIETDRDGFIEKLEDPNLSLVINRPAESARKYNNRANFRNAIGKTRYQNNGSAVGSYNLFVPFHVVHYWGEVVFRVQVPIVGTFDDETCIVWLDDMEVKATGVTLSQTSLVFDVAGSSAQLTADVQPSTATNRNVTWRSTNVKVATVNDNGLVTAVGNGTAQIIATTVDGSNKSATCAVTVNINAIPEPILVNDIADISNEKQYLIRTRDEARGTLGVANGELASTNPTAQVYKCEEATPFAILEFEGSYYLYSTADRKFITNTGGETDAPGQHATHAVALTKNCNGYFMFRFTNTGYVLNINSDPGIAINSWGQTEDKWDDGNQFTIEEVGSFDPADALAMFRTAVVEVTDEQYIAALKTVETDVQYNICTAYNGTRYYLTSDGYLTETTMEVGVFTFLRTEGDGLYRSPGWKLEACFSNPKLSNGASGDLNPQGHILTDRGNNRIDWEGQVWYLGDNGYYAVRATNAMSGEWGATTFWTVLDTDGNGKPEADYSWTPNFVWQIEKVQDTKGDVNGDGAVDLTDAIMIVYHSLGSTQQEGFKIGAADYNGDGQIDLTDAIEVLYKYLGAQ